MILTSPAKEKSGILKSDVLGTKACERGVMCDTRGTTSGGAIRVRCIQIVPATWKHWTIATKPMKHNVAAIGRARSDWGNGGARARALFARGDAGLRAGSPGGPESAGGAAPPTC